MRKCFSLCRDAFLFVVLLSLWSARLSGQTFTPLYSFTALSNSTNSDGANPYCAFAHSGNMLYGSTFNGGTGSNGVVFAINTDGTHFTNLYTFTAKSGIFRTNSDGAQCIGGVTLSGNTLYGTTGSGGSVGRGTIFAVNIDGSSFTNLHNFNGNADGSATIAGLVISGNSLYGDCQSGGSNGFGMVFSLNLNTLAYTNLHSFATTLNGTNADGGQPLARMIISGNTLFGTTISGGLGGKGSVFRINTDGSAFTNLHSFSALVSSTNSDGAQPFGGLALSGNSLYGVTPYGGTYSNGVLFRMNMDGSSFTNLHNFSMRNNFTNYDGAGPYGALFPSGTTLYGTTLAGGSYSNGTVFVVNTDGTGFRTLYNFTGLINNTNADGEAPVSGILSSNTVFGLARYGGSGGSGTVFSLFVPPSLAISLSGTNVILAWPTNADGFTLQSTPALAPTNWNNILLAPANLNGQNVVTNPVSGGQMFYRLAR